MKKTKKLPIFLLLFALSGCDIVQNSNSENSQLNSNSIENSESSSSSEEIIQLDFTPLNKVAFRFSSIHDIIMDGNTNIYMMNVPYDDNYTLTSNDVESMELLNYKGETIATHQSLIKVELKKDDLVYLKVSAPVQSKFDITVKLFNHYIELPYEINSSVNMDELSVYPEENANGVVTPWPAKYTKRDDGKGLYINCNNPEKISTQELNTVLTRQEVTDKDVFFTFEHNNEGSRFYYYGYRVTNTSDEDVYITVKNLGYQVDGAGSWLGENEWIQFYNLKFNMDTSSFTQSQLNNYKAYINFSNNYQPAMYSPTTYRLPKGEYMYVMGGTQEDAYDNINVFNTANKRVKGGCGNGAVIFSVSGGSAEGAFMAYTNPDTINNSSYILNHEEYGYRVDRDGVNVGSQYVGLDPVHGVVDADLCWAFNDQTTPRRFSVTYKNPYYTNVRSGSPYEEIKSFSEQEYDYANIWYTHINPNHTPGAFGTDMTKYITVDHVSKESIVIDPLHYDGRGSLANIGNWMVDYIDTITLVNQGDKERTFRYSLGHSGVILAFVRDENGLVLNDYTPKYCPMIGTSSYGDAISDGFVYEVTIAPHSIKRFSVNYNLLANSNGCINHRAELIK